MLTAKAYSSAKLFIHCRNKVFFVLAVVFLGLPNCSGSESKNNGNHWKRQFKILSMHQLMVVFYIIDLYLGQGFFVSFLSQNQFFPLEIVKYVVRQPEK